ncbi:MULTISPECIES: N-acetylglucosamine-6-phosphate deacetylase [Bacillaceae]|uniref:N-acetylglucosamine-6-phosphate deacetylase n=1 Tax=Evansella alkalicola TaxID=745819 RepID=A0ABS6JTZ1_9BACI|nr:MULTISPECIES: N-acetylglucosamine-6-phosphate deacetylase [Bacillaceae]MBU9721546.1 N-acetylglucosamine-6-phosphate deacetylase [Bacillus alkalicola]
MNLNEILLTNGKIYTGKGFLPGSVHIINGKIVNVWTGSNLEIEQQETASQPPHTTTKGNVETIDLLGNYLVPGFIDVHIHGGNGYDVMQATSPQEINEISIFLAKHGTTTFFPTTLTAPREDIEASLTNITEAKEQGTEGASIAGVHLEGPFINEKRAGAQNSAHIRNPSIEELKRYQYIFKNQVKLLTIAPEMPGALECIQYAVGEGIVCSVGHSDATMNMVKSAINHGLSHVTHLFNGMRPLHHREPGVAGAALMLDSLTVELISDGIHVHPDVLDYICKAKPRENIILISDATSAAGLGDGEECHLGGLPCFIKNGEVRLQKTGDLAGSCLTLDKALRNMMRFTNESLEAVIPLLTENPARKMGLGDMIGAIKEGYDADLVVLNEDYYVLKTFVKGREV